MGDVVNAVADVFGVGPASKQADATTSAANASAEASRYAADIQNQMFNKQIELQTPWREAGQNALSKLVAGINSGQYGTATPFSFTAQDFNTYQDPGYAFRLAEGNRALNQAAAARGGLISGNALKAAERYGQQMGSQEFQNAYNRALTGYNANQQARTNAYNQLAGISGTGQTSAQQIGAAAQSAGANLGNIAMQNASNQGNAALSMGNIRASQYGTAGSALNTLANVNWGKVGTSLNNMFGLDPYTATGLTSYGDGTYSAGDF